MKAPVLLCAAVVASVLTATPASAMNWKIYAPDADGHRYWLDTDSIVTGGDGYVYAYYVWGEAGGSAPTETSAPIIGIKCNTGDSIKLSDGKWIAGAHFYQRAFLFNALCPKSN